ncbi:MAG: hypothetical protein WBA33_12780, partial [Rhodanobacter lindaniclasticus]
GNVRRRIKLTTQHAGQPDHQQSPESSGQKHHAPGVDGKSPKELLALRCYVHEEGIEHSRYWQWCEQAEKLPELNRYTAVQCGKPWGKQPCSNNGS